MHPALLFEGERFRPGNAQSHLFVHPLHLISPQASPSVLEVLHFVSILVIAVELRSWAPVASSWK